MGWYEALSSALQKEDKAGEHVFGESSATHARPVLQLATIDTPSGTPRVRSLVHRGFLTARAYPTLPLMLITTDVRTPKVTQLAQNAVVEGVYWTPRANAQFRVRGRASVVPAPDRYGSAHPVLRGVVCDALEREGFDWEAKRVATFDAMGAHMRATWCRPPPGTPLGEDGEEEMKRWPERLPRVGEATDEREKRAVEVALSNFALLLIEPFEVDHVELGVQPERRRVFERDWEDERSVEFKETWVVP